MFLHPAHQAKLTMQVASNSYPISNIGRSFIFRNDGVVHRNFESRIIYYTHDCPSCHLGCTGASQTAETYSSSAHMAISVHRFRLVRLSGVPRSESFSSVSHQQMMAAKKISRPCLGYATPPFNRALSHRSLKS